MELYRKNKEQDPKENIWGTPQQTDDKYYPK